MAFTELYVKVPMKCCGPVATSPGFWMARAWRWLPMAAFTSLFALGALLGCNRKVVNPTSDTTNFAIQVSPNRATLNSGDRLQFTATVSGTSNQSISWNVNSLESSTGGSNIGTITQDGLYLAPTDLTETIEVQVLATSLADQTHNAPVNITVKPAVTQIATNRYYGSGVQFDVLSNVQVAQGDVDYRFRAASSGAATGFIWYDVYVRGGDTAGCSGIACECDGYGCGTGGTLQICIYPDDGSTSHLPTDPLTQQSTGLQRPPLACVSPANLRAGAVVRTETFPAPAKLIEGTLYHLHWHNSDPHPTLNFISVDDDCVWHPTAPRQPTIPDTDLEVMSIYNNGEKVIVKAVATDTPIFQLNYADGTTQGQGYIDSWNVAAVDISGKDRVRELFMVNGTDRTVTGVSVRVSRVSGASPLTVVLATKAGSVLAQGEIPAQQFPLGEALTSVASTSQNVTPAWGTYVFSSPAVLSLGESYQLILSASSDTVYQDYEIEKGAGYGFSTNTFFGDGYGQFSIDNGNSWAGFPQPGGDANSSQADIQFTFTTR